MKLRRVEFKNFKLLDGVSIHFSTQESKPLTVVRAENGSGKTSVLWGLSWALYGEGGLPIKNARLTSTHCAQDKPVLVQVTLEFSHDPDGLGTNEYVLTRTVEETPREGDDVQHGPMKVKLMIKRPQGDELVPGEPSAVLEQFFPRRLMDVFLTDGDRVQRFISGSVATRDRQHNVHQAIRALLGLDRLEVVEGDLIAIEKDFRQELASSGGSSAKEAQEELDKCETEIAELVRSHEEAVDKRSKIDDEIEDLEKSLAEIHGYGDIDAINGELSRARKDLAQAESDEAILLESIRSLFKSSETLSWSLACDPLQRGQKILSDLADRGVIPGLSLGVLQDRLESRVCICGESLAEGTSHREHVEQLLDEQRNISEERERLTATFHRTRAGLEQYEIALSDGQEFWSQRPLMLTKYGETSERMTDANLRIKAAETRRAAIDEEQVRRFTGRLEIAKTHHMEESERIGALETRLSDHDEQRLVLVARYEKAQKAATSDIRAKNRHELASDLRKLVSEALRVLKTEHVGAVSTRMNEIFMEIVGSSPELASAVFKGVHLTDEFDIVVDAGNKKTLDTDYEVNGASQRALTLAFIWSLMEVAATVLPRIIDTPLGMTAGGVKRRMVDSITRPVVAGQLDYQVVLLLTRSEIRDIEDLLDERSGKFVTLSCSKDFPVDLLHGWSVDEPTIRSCACSHRQFCDVCERQSDVDFHLTRRF